MKKEAENNLLNYQKKVKQLFTDLETWSKEYALLTKKEFISILEEDYDEYSIEKLLIMDETGNKIAEIVPIASSVLGANGRVDIQGIYDSVILVDLDKGGPTFTIRGKEGQFEQRFFYRGINEAGWYWFEHNVSTKGHKLSADIFLEILDYVSDYVSS